MTGLTMHIQGKDRVLNALRLVADPATRREMLDDVGAYGVSSTQERFLQQKGPSGHSWKKSRRAIQFGGQTLRDSNRLFQSLTHAFTDNSASWGTNVAYAAIHQKGGVIRPRNKKKLMFKGMNGFVMVDKVTIPARPYMGVNNEDREEIELIAQDHLARALEQGAAS